MFFQCSSFNNGGQTGINDWNTSKINNTFQELFRGCTVFNQPINGWDVTGVTDMTRMFQETNAFDQDLSSWRPSSCTSLEITFYNSKFNNGGETGINDWDVSNVQDFRLCFGLCPFNQPVGDWDLSSATNIVGMFQNNTAFDQDLGNWVFPATVTSLAQLFQNCSTFTNAGQTGINNWDTSNIVTMTQSFDECTGFNQPIGSWDVSNVTSFNETFRDCNSFNNGGSDSISGWNTSSVTTMNRMFQNCSDFNQPIGYWDTSSLQIIDIMLFNASSFDQELSNWTVTGLTSAGNFMNGSISTENYDLTLSGWAQQSGDLQAGVSINFGTSQYSIATGEQYRDILTGVGWTITDGGSV
jgi:surface protein